MRSEHEKPLTCYHKELENWNFKASFRDCNRLLDSFVGRASCVRKNHGRRVTNVHPICITMFENKKLLKDHFKIKQRTKLRNGFLNRRFHFVNCHPAFLQCSILMRMSFAKPINFKYSLPLILVSFNFKFLFSPFNQIFRLFNLVVERITSACEYSIE